MPDLGTIIILAVVFILVGFLGGVMVSMLFTDRSKETPSEPVKEPSKRQERELVRLLQEQPGGKISLGIGDKNYPDTGKLSERQRKVLFALANEWMSWLETPEEVSGSAAQSVPVEPIPQPPAGFSSEQSSVRIDRDPKTEKAEEPVIVVEHPLVSADAQPKSDSMVEQIDLILQKLLVQSPLKDRPVRITEDPAEGVVVWLGVDRYIGIDSVPDDAVRALIREAVAEWERRPKK